MPKELLQKEEINRFKTIYNRIEEAMAIKGYKTIAELNAAITKKRGDCPDKSIYSKLQNPPRLGQEYYNMSIENLYVIADALDVSTDYLLGITDIKVRVDDIEVNALGLSDSSLIKLKSLRSSAVNYDPQKIRSTSRYYLNPYNKVLKVLNWIIDHTDINEDEAHNDHYDFLTSLYHLIMLNFEEYRGAVMEAVINEAIANTDSDIENYEQLLYKFQNPVIDETDTETETAEKLRLARRKFIQSEATNEERATILKDIVDGIVTVGDPVTYDQVRIKLANPHDAFMDSIKNTIEKWNEEYKPIYDKEKEQQKEDYEKWFATVKDELFLAPIEEDTIEKEYLPDNELYLSPFMRTMNTSEQKKYILYTYIETTELMRMRISADGHVSFANPGISNFVDIIKKAESDEIGLYLTEEGSVFYSEDKAMEPSLRAEALFNRCNLPGILVEWMKNPESSFSSLGYFNTEILYSDRSQEEADEIIARAKEMGAVYGIKGTYIEVHKKAKL